MAHPKLRACRGIELLDNLAELGQTVTQKLTGICDYRAVPCAPITVVQGNILEQDWSDANIIFAASVCFSNELIDAFADKCALLQKGARIMFMNYLPERPYIKEVASLKGQFTWGLHLIRFFTIV